MAIKLRLDEPMYSLYSKEENQYVYTASGDYLFSGVPKASGMAVSVDKINAKKKSLLAKLNEWATHDVAREDQHLYRYEAGKPPFAHLTAEELQAIRDENAANERAVYAKRLETASKFIIVKLEVTEIIT